MKVKGKHWILFGCSAVSLCLVFCKEPPRQPPAEMTFSYRQLADDSIRCQLISPDRFVLAQEKKIALTNGTLSQHTYTVDQEMGISYTKYNFSDVDQTVPYRDNITLLGRKYVIDSLFYGSEFSGDVPNRVSALNGVYRFDFAGRNYVCFYIQDLTNPVAMPNTNVLLFDITDRRKILAVLDDIQASEDLRCFGDFDKNRKLDYASWSRGNDFKDTLELYELRNNRFALNPAKYVIVRDVSSGYKIDLAKSKWFAQSPIGRASGR